MRPEAFTLTSGSQQLRYCKITSDGCGLEPCEPVHRHDLDPVPPRLRPGGEPGLERVLRAPLDHVQQPRGTGAVADRGEVDDHGDVLVPAPGVPPDVLVDAR